jgi:hypothetical protein
MRSVRFLFLFALVALSTTILKAMDATGGQIDWGTIR